MPPTTPNGIETVPKQYVLRDRRTALSQFHNIDERQAKLKQTNTNAIGKHKIRQTKHNGEPQKNRAALTLQ